MLQNKNICRRAAADDWGYGCLRHSQHQNTTNHREGGRKITHFCRENERLWAKEHTCLEQTFAVVDGYVDAPSGPGLGISLDMDAVNRYAVAG